MRAAAFAPDVSRLLGVHVGGMLTLGWALAAAVGSLAGMLVIPTELGLHPNAMDIVFISSFTAAVVGGLDSAVGAVVGGLVVGLLLSYVSGYLGATVAPMAVLILLRGRAAGPAGRAVLPVGGEDGMTSTQDARQGRRPRPRIRRLRIERRCCTCVAGRRDRSSWR